MTPLRYAPLAALVGALLASQALAQAPDPAGQERLRTELRKRFGAADTNVDGRLTREEAKGKMPGVYRNFDAIDSAHTGAVTMEQIEAYAASRRGRRAGGD